MQRKPKPTLQDKAEDNPELEAAMGFPLFNDGPPEGKLG